MVEIFYKYIKYDLRLLVLINYVFIISNDLSASFFSKQLFVYFKHLNVGTRLSITAIVSIGFTEFVLVIFGSAVFNVLKWTYLDAIEILAPNFGSKFFNRF